MQGAAHGRSGEQEKEDVGAAAGSTRIFEQPTLVRESHPPQHSEPDLQISQSTEFAEFQLTCIDNSEGSVTICLLLARVQSILQGYLAHAQTRSPDPPRA